jgi:hypothetical protein
MSRDGEISSEEAGQNYLLAHRRFFSPPSTDENALREYEDASTALLATFAESIEKVTQAAEACKAYRCAPVRSVKNSGTSLVAKAVGRTWRRLLNKPDTDRNRG